MDTIYMPTIDHHGPLSKKRMHLRPMLPMPINYETAAIPTFAPFGTEYTPDHSIKIIGGRRISIPHSIASIPRPPPSYPSTQQPPANNLDPDFVPNKALQHVHAFDNAQWQQPVRPRFDTTYRTEYINRIRHPEYVPWYQQLPMNAKAQPQPQRKSNSSFNQYNILPPINPSGPPAMNKFRSTGSARSAATDIPRSNQNQEIKPNDVPPLNFNNGTQNFLDGPPPPPPPQQQQAYDQPTMNNDDTYLPEEPVLLTNYEEERLAEQIRVQLGRSTSVEKLKIFYQELTAYDPNVTGSVHYSNIQLVASQLGLNLQDDTFRFAMCKFVSPDRGRGFVNYEDMVRYFGKCLSSISPNQYDTQQSNLNRTKQSMGNGVTDDDSNFDPDERQMRILLKQNLKYFDVSGTIDFEKLSRELNHADRNQSGFLNRQQIEEVVYKVRIPIQRSLIFQILEKHCRAFASLYRWEAFVQYLKGQILDLKEVQDQANSTNGTKMPTHSQWLEQMRREYLEKDRLHVIDRFIKLHESSRIGSLHPTAWFARFLRMANAMYGHRTSTNREQDFVLPREEARRLFRAYNQVWDLKIDEDRLQRVLDACGRNGNTGIDDALKVFARQGQ